MNKLVTTLMFLLLVTIVVRGQKNSEAFRNKILTDEPIAKTDIKNEFIKNDISTLLTQTDNGRVLGFIGDNYQRIQIKFISVIKNKENPGEYDKGVVYPQVVRKPSTKFKPTNYERTTSFNANSLIF